MDKALEILRRIVSCDDRTGLKDEDAGAACDSWWVQTYDLSSALDDARALLAEHGALPEPPRRQTPAEAEAILREHMEKIAGGRLRG